MAANTQIFRFEDSVIAAGATDIQTYPIVPSGVDLMLQVFGGCEKNPVAESHGIIALQWGSGGSWVTVRAGGGAGFEYHIDRTIIGNGTDRLRVVRVNTGITTRQMVSWLEAFLKDG